MGGLSPAYKMSWIYTAAAGIVSGILGAMGMGGGGILVIVLTIFMGYEQSLAQGINLIFFIPCAITAIIIYSRKKLINWKITVPFSLLGCIGSIIGATVSFHTDSKILSVIFGIMLLILGIKELFAKNKS